MKAALALYIGLLAILGYARLDGRGFSGARADSEAAYAARQNEIKRTPVVVELFTSEGCSNCPAADAFLARLIRAQPVEGAGVIALEEHVDYWDQQGWRDPYSAAKFTERQNWYATAFHNNSSYTPQMVVDGRAEFVGSHERKARQVIAESAKLPKTGMSIAVAGEIGRSSEIPLEIRVEKLSGAAAGDRSDIFLAITENGLHSEVARGENAGRKLDHYGVVRSLERIETARAGKDGTNADTGFSTTVHVKTASNWKRENLHAVAFLQERRSRHILGATEISLG